MALQPSLNPLIVAGTNDAPHTLDVFRECFLEFTCRPEPLTFFAVDYVCPFRFTILRLCGYLVHG